MPGLLQMKAGRSQKWVLSSAQDATEACAGEPWCLRFFLEYVSELEDLSLIIEARPKGRGSSIVLGNTPKGSGTGGSVKLGSVVEEFWCVHTPDASTAAAVFAAVSAALAPETIDIGRHCSPQPTSSAETLSRSSHSVSITEGCALPDHEHRDARLLRASMKAYDGELRATRLVISTQCREVELETEVPLDEEEAAKDSFGRSGDSAHSGSQLSSFSAGEMAFLPFIRKSPEVRILSAELRVAVEGVLQLRAASALLGVKFKSMGICEAEGCKLKRLILPWMQSGTSDLPDDVLSGLVWGFSFGWPDDFSTCLLK